MYGGSLAYMRAKQELFYVQPLLYLWVYHPAIEIINRHMMILRPAFFAKLYGLLAATITIFMAFSLSAPSFAQNVPAAGQITLPGTINVSDAYITLGDIFGPTVEKRSTRVARSPAPGKKLILDYVWLSKVARAYKVNWRATSRLDQVVVYRDGKRITYQDFADALKRELELIGLDKNSEIMLANTRLDIFVPNLDTIQIGVSNLQWDKRSNRFTAIVDVPKDHPEATRLSISGRIFEQELVPVLIRSLPKGTIITEEDVTFISVRKNKIRRNIVMEPGQLVGKETLKYLQAEKILTTRDVREPILVTKGDIVIMKISKGAMTLTAKATALESGAQGDTIQLENTLSRRKIRGRIIAPGEVEVLLMDAPL
jgi:flagella basal body P-ring formation protein FlgA